MPSISQCTAASALIVLCVIRATAGENVAYKPAEMDPACKGGSPAGQHETKDLPAQFKEFVPFIHADERLLTVACMTAPDRAGMRFLTATKAPTKMGSVSILVRQPDNSLRLEAVNHTVVQVNGYEGSGASGGFERMGSSRPGLFTIDISGGDSVQRTDYEFQFRYSPAEKTWLLYSVVTKVFTRDIDLEHRKEKDDITTEKQTAKDFGHVTFSEFDGAKFGLGD
jgi:hypothetical protein